MLNVFDIVNNVIWFKQPTALKYLIEGKGDKKNVPNVNSNTKPIITMHDTKQIKNK